jgi:hypothetical protein
MLKNYNVEITAQIPYPHKEIVTEVAGSMGTAINRAIRKFRKLVKGRTHLKELLIKVYQF